jgi:hypothetical protein
MQMKTAMQELIQSLKAEHMIASNEWQMGYQKALSNVILEIESMLEKEKEQIKDAHIDGQGLFDDYPHAQWAKAEAYYKKTYNKK